MNKNECIIRLEKKEDYRETENVVREAFWNVCRLGWVEYFVLHNLRDDEAFVKELDFVLVKDDKIIGQNVFVKAVIEADDERNIPIMTMWPIGILPEFKRQGYGKMLLDYSLEQARKMGVGALCFEGNIDFYGKSGFDYASNFGVRYHGLPDGVDASFFICKELKEGFLDGVTGEYSTPECYVVDENETEKFDETFPKKKKEKKEGQIF